VKKKRAKAKPLSKLRDKAWSLFSLIVRRMAADNREQVTCVTCDKQLHYREAHAGHFIPRARGIACYFECHNVHVQCPGCNFYGGEMVKIRYTQWMTRMYGQDEVDRLIALSGTVKKMTRADYETLIEHYQMCAEEL
jgi:Bacteriophage Lambda NinG protein